MALPVLVWVGVAAAGAAAAAITAAVSSGSGSSGSSESERIRAAEEERRKEVEQRKRRKRTEIRDEIAAEIDRALRGSGLFDEANLPEGSFSFTAVKTFAKGLTSEPKSTASGLSGEHLSMLSAMLDSTAQHTGRPLGQSAQSAALEGLAHALGGVAVSRLAEQLDDTPLGHVLTELDPPEREVIAQAFSRLQLLGINLRALEPAEALAGDLDTLRRLRDEIIFLEGLLPLLEEARAEAEEQ